MIARRLFEPVAPQSLAFFRIAFGAILLWESVRFHQSGWVREHCVAPTFHFTYFGFGWVAPLPERSLDAIVIGLGGCCAAIAIGWRTRAAALLFFLGFAYFFLLEQARYLNHFYLVLLLALLLAWVPTDRAWSLAARGGERPAPRWALLLVRAQIAIVYGFAALAKCNGDWLHAQPLRMWVKGRADRMAEVPLLGPLLAQSWTPWLMSWSGLLLDLLAVPLLLVRRTRGVMFALLCAFHLTNAALFDIGIFPWLSIAATTIFFEPDWPQRLVRRLRRAPAAAPPRWLAAPLARPSRGTLMLLAAWLGFQLVFPLRHLLYPGDVAWTEEGHRFSWRMKLRSKSARATFVVTDPQGGERRLVDPRVELADWQYRKMSDRPDMVLQYAHHLAERFTVVDAAGARRRPQVRAIVDCSLNGRDPQPLIDPGIDLAAQPRTLRHASWIVPLRERLKPDWETGRFELDE